MADDLCSDDEFGDEAICSFLNRDFFIFKKATFCRTDIYLDLFEKDYRIRDSGCLGDRQHSTR